MESDANFDIEDYIGELLTLEMALSDNYYKKYAETFLQWKEKEPNTYLVNKSNFSSSRDELVELMQSAEIFNIAGMPLFLKLVTEPLIQYDEETTINQTPYDYNINLKFFRNLFEDNLKAMDDNQNDILLIHDYKIKDGHVDGILLYQPSLDLIKTYDNKYQLVKTETLESFENESE